VIHALILLRHGESEWNRENRFTGWAGVDLTPNGRQQAKATGGLLRDRDFGRHYGALQGLNKVRYGSLRTGSTEILAAKL
jgi:bisphosphoglycerate-dependent phosphoglycerate mutase